MPIHGLAIAVLLLGCGLHHVGRLRQAIGILVLIRVLQLVRGLLLVSFDWCHEHLSQVLLATDGTLSVGIEKTFEITVLILHLGDDLVQVLILGCIGLDFALQIGQPLLLPLATL